MHLGQFAVGGAGLVFTEATAVMPEGRISPQDLGIWDDAHVPMLQRITRFIEAQGAVPGMQLAHAGRKASTQRPWEGHGLVPPDAGGWTNVMAPSAIAFSPTYPQPHALTLDGIAAVVAAFRAAAMRAMAAGFRVLEAARRPRLPAAPVPVAAVQPARRRLRRAARESGPALPRGRGGGARGRARGDARWSCGSRPPTGPTAAGPSRNRSQLAAWLKDAGVDMIDVSSGGLASGVRVPIGPGYQVPFARQVRHGAGITTASVGLITDAAQAEQIVRDGDADMVLLARELLRQPHWPLLAAHALGAAVWWPVQYERAHPDGPPKR